MKIVVLGLRGFPGIQGGVETHCEHLYPRIAALGDTVVVMCRRPYVTHPESTFHGVQLVALPCPRSRSLEAFVHTFIGVFAALRLRPDMLHIHAIGPALMVPVARLLGLRVVYTNHGPDYDRQKWGRWAKRLLKLGEALGTRFAHGTVAITKPIASQLRIRYRRESTVIPNGVVVRSRESGVETLGRFGLEPGRYVLGVGRLVPEKGFHDLMDAFAVAALAGWKLVIVGRADHEDDYSASLMRKAATVPDVVLTGFVNGEPLRQLYSHAGLFALPSYHEGLPIVLLEAMGYGLQIVASDIPANRQAGLTDDHFFPPGDIDRAARRLVHFAAHPLDDRQRAAQVAAIERTFDWDTIARQTRDFYAARLRHPKTAPAPDVERSPADATDRPG